MNFFPEWSRGEKIEFSFVWFRLEQVFFIISCYGSEVWCWFFYGFRIMKTLNQILVSFFFLHFDLWIFVQRRENIKEEKKKNRKIIMLINWFFVSLAMFTNDDDDVGTWFLTLALLFLISFFFFLVSRRFSSEELCRQIGYWLVVFVFAYLLGSSLTGSLTTYKCCWPGFLSCVPR